MIKVVLFVLVSVLLFSFHPAFLVVVWLGLLVVKLVSL